MAGPGDRDLPTTEELRALQAEREETERELAESAAEETEERAHRRRSERAASLREKLDEQAESESE